MAAAALAVDWNFRCLDWLGRVLKWKQGPWADPGPADGREVPVPGTNEGQPGGLRFPVGEASPGYPAWWKQEPSPVRPDLDLADRILPGNFQDPSSTLAPSYPQVFADRYGFQPGLSILDLLFCLGPASRQWLETCPLPGPGSVS